MKSNLILIEMTLFQIGKESVFSELIKYLVYSLYIGLVKVFSIDQDIFHINDDKNVKLFSKDFIYIILEASQSIRESKRHDLILEVTILGLEGSFPFVAFSNFHSIISIG